MEQSMSFYDIDLVTIDGKPQKMDVYRGKTLIIVNVASQCGFTPQYAGLQTLYDKFKARGVAVLGFPCDQFGHQEPGGEAEIEQFCTRNFGVTFPMFAKIDVNGVNAHPLYKYLKAEKRGILGTEAIKWNFTKFLVGSDGTVVKRYAPSDKPEAIEADLAAKL
jgi:glutathione peroxidase